MGETQIRKMETIQEKKQNKIMVWFSNNPIVGVLGIALSVISIFLSVIFYIGSIAKPDLTYFVHPVKGIALQSNQATDLTVYYKNREIKGDLTVAQIAIWNHGKKPIKHSDILETIKIVTSSQFPILEAKIRKTTRSVTGISLDTTKSDLGVIGIDWRVLEQDDGAIIQIIYEGSQDVNISVLGVVEG